MAWQTRGENSARDYNSLLPVVSPLSEFSSLGHDCFSNQITEEELSHELQAAFKWAARGFQARDACANSSETDPFEEQALRKAAFGLTSAAIRLLASEDALMSILEVLAVLIHALHSIDG